MRDRQHLVELASADYPWLAWEHFEGHALAFLRTLHPHCRFVVSVTHFHVCLFVYMFDYFSMFSYFGPLCMYDKSGFSMLGVINHHDVIRVIIVVLNERS